MDGDGDGDGFLARIGKRILSIINSLLRMFTGGGGGDNGIQLNLPKLDIFRSSKRDTTVSDSEMERQLSNLLSLGRNN